MHLLFYLIIAVIVLMYFVRVCGAPRQQNHCNPGQFFMLFATTCIIQDKQSHIYFILSYDKLIVSNLLLACH